MIPAYIVYLMCVGFFFLKCLSSYRICLMKCSIIEVTVVLYMYIKLCGVKILAC